MLSSSLEQYLIHIYKLSEQGQEIKSSDLSTELSMPLKKTIQALQRMHFQKYIIYLAYQPITITDKGKEMARYLVSRDTLIDEFLDILQLTDHKEEERESLKQFLSYETLESIERFVCFVRQYPEIMNRYRLYNKRKMRCKILEPLPEEE
ncbi:MAG: iron dependent repressor, metal binding and dimerization domain protein [Niameybacter sp.]|uniref:metal-dependent transcriptional regulator n=1 Tax=Niameybacter sp. TaxID=2033640 RepID=UPI002FCA7822